MPATVIATSLPARELSLWGDRLAVEGTGYSFTPRQGAVLPLAIAGTGYGLIGLLLIILLVVLIVFFLRRA